MSAILQGEGDVDMREAGTISTSLCQTARKMYKKIVRNCSKITFNTACLFLR